MNRAQKRFKLGVQIQHRYPAIQIHKQTIVEYFMLLEELDKEESSNNG